MRGAPASGSDSSALASTCQWQHERRAFQKHLELSAHAGRKRRRPDHGPAACYRSRCGDLQAEEIARWPSHWPGHCDGCFGARAEQDTAEASSLHLLQTALRLVQRQEEAAYTLLAILQEELQAVTDRRRQVKRLSTYSKHVGRVHSQMADSKNYTQAALTAAQLHLDDMNGQLQGPAQLSLPEVTAALGAIPGAHGSLPSRAASATVSEQLQHAASVLAGIEAAQASRLADIRERGDQMSTWLATLRRAPAAAALSDTEDSSTLQTNTVKQQSQWSEVLSRDVDYQPGFPNMLASFVNVAGLVLSGLASCWTIANLADMGIHARTAFDACFSILVILALAYVSWMALQPQKRSTEM
jgi:hypothetical protein